MLEAKIENGKLIVTIPLYAQPMPSASGKTLVVASTRGNFKSSAVANGRAVTIGLNAFISK